MNLVGLSLNSKAFAASDMTVFLKCSGYGAAAGAILGLASLAVSDNPSGKINNVARGASLGLYAGVGFGLYSINSRSLPSQRQEEAFNLNQVWLSPVFHVSQIDGGQINWLNLSF